MAAIGSVWLWLAPMVVAWLLTFVLHSTLLLGSVWLVSRYVRSQRLKDVFWKAALVGGVLTAMLQVAVGLQPLAGRFDLAPGTAPMSLDQERINTEPGTVSQARGTNDAIAELDQEATQLSTSRFLESNAGLQAVWRGVTSLRGQLAALLWRRAGWLLGLWLLGVAIAGLRLGLARRRLCASLGQRHDVADGPLYDMLAHLRQVAGVHYAVRLTCSPHAFGPLLVKAREICLPQRALTQLGVEQQKSLLAHELAHVVRRDPMWLTVLGVFECLFFFQPLFRLSRRAMRECAEYLCDDLAARYTESGLSLARCLVEVAGWLPSRTRLVTVASMAESASNLERRILRLLDGSWSGKPETLRWWWVIVVVGVLVLVGVVGPGVSAKANSALPSEPAGVEEPSVEQPGGEQPSVEQQSVEQPGVEQQSVEQPGGEQPSVEQNSPWEVVVEGKVAIPCSSSEVRTWLDETMLTLSADGCQSTQDVPLPPGSRPFAFASFIDAQIGWVASSAQPSLWVTGDSGQTWWETALPTEIESIAAIQLRTAQDGYLLTTSGLLYGTRDGGKTWSCQTLPINREGMFIPDVVLPSAGLHFWNVSQGVVVILLVGGSRSEILALRTANGGLTWTPESIPAEPGTFYMVEHGTVLLVEGWRGQTTVLRSQEP